MKKIFTALCLGLVFLAAHLSAEKRAVTEDGQKVILFNNGTWRPEEQPLEMFPAKTVNPQKFTRPRSAGANLTGRNNLYKLWYDPARWRKLENNLVEVSEYSLLHAEGSAYCIIISERAEFNLSALKKLVLQNAKAAAPNASITFEEIRNVNGKDLLHMRLNGTIDGVKFIYYNYLYTGPGGSVQIITFTTEELFPEYRNEMEQILNGFEITN